MKSEAVQYVGRVYSRSFWALMIGTALFFAGMFALGFGQEALAHTLHLPAGLLLGFGAGRGHLMSRIEDLRRKALL